jgi:hypothetical protein
MLDADIEPSIILLNSMTYLYSSAMRQVELESEILPLYDKYHIKHDVYTYQHLSKLFLNIRELKTVMMLYDRLKNEDGFKPNQSLLDIAFEASLRLNKSDLMV